MIEQVFDHEVEVLKNHDDRIGLVKSEKYNRFYVVNDFGGDWDSWDFTDLESAEKFYEELVNED